MKKEILYNKLNEGLSLRKIASSLNVSYTTVRYWAKKYNLKKRILKQCTVCSSRLSGNQVKYCSNACKAKAHYYKETHANSYHSQTLRGVRRKLTFIKELGGKCKLCGYNKNLAALEFHHREPSTKLLRLDLRSLSNHSVKVLRQELIKCDLLCSNCHKESHYPHYFLSTLNQLS